jgi:hypothetical protein
MGRPRGGGIYDGDSASDFLSTIAGRFQRELAYWLAAENHFNDGFWLERLLAVIEGILLLEKHNDNSTVSLSRENPKAVEHWSEVFFSIWDGDWKGKETYFPSNEPEYRHQHRPAVIAIFDHLQSIAVFWESVGKSSERPDLTPLHPDYPLPYFSIKRLINKNSKDNREEIHVNPFIRDQLESLLKDIIYYLSPEKRAVDISSDGEEVWVAADILAFFCTAYEQTPRVHEEIVRTWRKAVIDIEKQFDEDWDETDGLYQEVMGVFDRLEAVARKYPPMEW